MSKQRMGHCVTIVRACNWQGAQRVPALTVRFAIELPLPGFGEQVELAPGLAGRGWVAIEGLKPLTLFSGKHGEFFKSCCCC